jgi:hypothetical protein
MVWQYHTILHMKKGFAGNTEDLRRLRVLGKIKED